MSFTFKHPYAFQEEFSKPVAYFCMEYAIHQPLKLYAGGLGFLAGSHLRSAFELRQNIVGIGILWKYGYYDQVRRSDQGMDVLFQEKIYKFLVDTKIRFTVKVAGHDVSIAAWYLDPIIFNTAPLFLLSTELPENDYLSKTITHKLYDSNPQSRLAADIVLGIGGARLLEILNYEPEKYHFNESHALPLAFHLYNKFKNIAEVKKRLVFTNHTPEKSGNPKSEVSLLERMGFFCDIPQTEVRSITQTEGNIFDHTLAAFRLSGIANAVSKSHYQTLINNYQDQTGLCNIISITNAQNFNYWANKKMYQALNDKTDDILRQQKRNCKAKLFEIVADQSGEIFNKDVLTVVFAKRFAGYKRPELLLNNMERFEHLISNKDRPIQIIWAGKPYPVDYAAIETFNRIANFCKSYSNCAILIGYELRLSKMLKQGADVWLNNPRLTHEASGTSGMSAAMNGAINLSIPDGWFPEFAKDLENCFVIHGCNANLPEHEQDQNDANYLFDVLEKEIIPMYYDYPDRWLNIIKNSMFDIQDEYNSNRMMREYYEKLYC